MIKDLLQDSFIQLKIMSCSQCKKTDNLDGTFHCCGTRVCLGCVFAVFGKEPIVCVLCNANPRECVMKKVNEERKSNPNEAHIAISIPCAVKDRMIKIPINGEALAMEIMNELGKIVGLDLSKEVEGGIFDHRLIYRDRYLDLHKSMHDNGWVTGIANMNLVQSRTPAAFSTHS